MKNTILVLLCSLFTLGVSAQKSSPFVETQDVTFDVIAPKGAHPLIGRPNQKKPTDVVFQKDGEDTGVYGKLEFISTGDEVSVYRCEGLKFILPNSAYKMNLRRNVLETSSGQSVEALMVDISTDYECAVLKIRKDSTTVNTMQEYKLVLNLPMDSMRWKGTSYSIFPSLESSVLDAVDPDEDAKYTLAVKTEDGKTCKMFRFNRELSQFGGNKEMVYQVPERENSNFALNENGQELIAGKVIGGYMILKDFQTIVKKKGRKTQRHKKRAKF